MPYQFLQFAALCCGCSLVALTASGCQKLPPGVLAGSPHQPSDQPTARSDEPQPPVKATSEPASNSTELPIETVHAEVAQLRAERDRLRDELLAAQESIVEAQVQINELLRQRIAEQDERIAAIKAHQQQAAPIQVAEELTPESSPASVQ